MEKGTLKPQQGGMFTPGIAALIAAILSGGVGAYGFSKVGEADRAQIRTAVEENLKRQIGQQLREEANATVLKKEQEIKQLQAEVAELKASAEKAKAAEEVASDLNFTFRNAKPAVLRAAVPIVISKLAAAYPWIKGDGSALEKELNYPASTQGQVLGMTLMNFYRRRVEPALRMDLQASTKGGRRRRRRRARGGVTDTPEEREEKEETLAEDQNAPVFNVEEKEKMEDFLAEEDEAPAAAVPEAPAEAPAETPEAPAAAAAAAASPYPLYDEFAPLYVEAIKEATQMVATDVETKKKTDKETAQQAKKDAAAKKAAQAIIAKFDKAIKAAETALATPVPEQQTELVRSDKISLMETLDKVRELVGMAPPTKKKRFGFFGGASNLREVTTEVDWEELNTPQKAEELLKQLQDATKFYLDAVKSLPSPDAPVPEPVAADTEEEPISRQTSASEPGSTTSLGKEITVLNPMFATERLKEAKEAEEAELFSQVPGLPPIKKTRRTDFGGPTLARMDGGMRKRTLKKRRGGKQNDRGSRDRKNRANRSHSHSR
jgi:hypothetical protein